MRWIGSSDAYKAKVWRAEARKVDYAAEFDRIKNAAANVTGRPAQVARRLEELRREWRSLKRWQQFAETGITVL